MGMTQMKLTITPNDGPAFSMRFPARDLASIEKDIDIKITSGKIKDAKISEG